MIDAFIYVVDSSILSIAFMLFVFLARELFKNISKRIICVLWVLLAVRVLFPYAIECGASVIPIARPFSDYVTDMRYQFNNVGQLIEGCVVENNALDIDNVGLTRKGIEPIAIGWAAGAGCILLYACVNDGILRYKLKLSTLCEKGIRQSEYVKSPFLLGVFRPIIYVPYEFDLMNDRIVIEHELMHIKRGDNVWKPLGYILLAIFWVNPLAWLSYYFFCQDLEFACDEMVVCNLSISLKQKYSRLLLRYSTGSGEACAFPVAFGVSGVKERINRIMKVKKTSTLVILFFSFVVVIASLGLVTNPKREKNLIDSVKYYSSHMPLDKRSLMKYEDLIGKMLGEEMEIDTKQIRVAVSNASSGSLGVTVVVYTDDYTNMVEREKHSEIFLSNLLEVDSSDVCVKFILEE